MIKLTGGRGIDISVRENHIVTISTVVDFKDNPEVKAMLCLATGQIVFVQETYDQVVALVESAERGY